MSAMRFREVRREAGRNLSSGASRAVLLMLLVAAGSATLAALDTAEMTGVIRAAEDFRARGASITILVAEDSIDGRACDALGRLDGVRAAGALAERETPLRVASIPQNPLTYFESSPGFATMLPAATGGTEPGLLMPIAVVETLGLTLGDPIQTADGPTTLGGTYEYPDDGRTTGMGYAAIAPIAPDSKFDECWIDAFPVSQATTDLLYTAIAADSNLPDTGPQLSQHNLQLGKPVNPESAFAGRSTGAFPLAGFGIGAMVGFGAVWLRRLEIASAFHVGVQRSDQTVTLLLEALAWSCAGALVAFPAIALLTQNLAASDLIPVAATAALTPALTVSGAILGTLAAALLVRERRLFSYFKGR